MISFTETENPFGVVLNAFKQATSSGPSVIGLGLGTAVNVQNDGSCLPRQSSLTQRGGIESALEGSPPPTRPHS